MDEKILFKAMEVLTGKWIEGYYAYAKWYLDDSARHIIIPTDFTLFPHCEISEYEVIMPETLCRYTGRTDKNGIKIWENDILQLEDRLVKVYWLDENAQFDCEFVKHNKNIVITNFKGVEPRDYEHYEVVGNIFDNPELLSATQEGEQWED